MIELLELCLPLDDTLDEFRSDLIRLDRYAVHYRYPGETANKMQAKMAYEATTTVRIALQAKLKGEG